MRKIPEGIKDFKSGSAANSADQFDQQHSKPNSTLIVEDFNHRYPCIFESSDQFLDLIVEYLSVSISDNRSKAKIKTPFCREKQDRAQCFHYPLRQYLERVIKALYTKNIICNQANDDIYISEHAAIQHYLFCMVICIDLYFEEQKKDFLHQGNVHLLIMCSLTLILNDHGVIGNPERLAEIFEYSRPKGHLTKEDAQWLFRSNIETKDYTKSQNIHAKVSGDNLNPYAQRYVLLAQLFSGFFESSFVVDEEHYLGYYEQFQARHLDKKISRALVEKINENNNKNTIPVVDVPNRFKFFDQYIYNLRNKLFTNVCLDDVQYDFYSAIHYRLSCMYHYVITFIDAFEVTLDTCNVGILIAVSFMLVNSIFQNNEIEEKDFFEFFEFKKIEEQCQKEGLELDLPKEAGFLKNNFLPFFSNPKEFKALTVLDEMNIRIHHFQISQEFVPLVLYLWILKNSAELEPLVRQDEKKKANLPIQFKCQRHSLNDYMWLLVRRLYFTKIFDSKKSIAGGSVPLIWEIALQAAVKATKYLQLYLADKQNSSNIHNMHLLIAASFYIVQKMDDCDGDNGFNGPDFIILAELETSYNKQERKKAFHLVDEMSLISDAKSISFEAVVRDSKQATQRTSKIPPQPPGELILTERMLRDSEERKVDSLKILNKLEREFLRIIFNATGIEDFRADHGIAPSERVEPKTPPPSPVVALNLTNQARVSSVKQLEVATAAAAASIESKRGCSLM